MQPAQPVAEIWKERCPIPCALLPLGGQNQRSSSGCHGCQPRRGELRRPLLVDLPVIYSPYTVARDYRLCFLPFNRNRYWLKTDGRPLFGVHLHIGAFNIAVDDRNRYQSPDGFYGAGLSYGYMLPRPPLGGRVHHRSGIRPHEIRRLVIISPTAPASRREYLTTIGARSAGSVWFTDSEKGARSRR
ncbi:MAG: DUF3575 domain-containing protein [Alistipes ihumii]